MATIALKSFETELSHLWGSTGECSCGAAVVVLDDGMVVCPVARPDTQAVKDEAAIAAMFTALYGEPIVATKQAEAAVNRTALLDWCNMALVNGK